MSLFCFCIVGDVQKNGDASFYTQELKKLAKYHNRGIKFSVDWVEPILFDIQKDDFIVNILDCTESNNCELFLLPDGWYINGHSNKLTFRERMTFLRDVLQFFIDKKRNVELYLGLSGTDPEEFTHIVLKSNDVVDYLVNTIGVYGLDDGLHISVIP